MAKNTSPLEKEESRAFAKWLDTTGLLFSHVANVNMNKLQGIRNHQAGVRRGVPDYLIITKKGLVFVELKREQGGVLSREQKDWIQALNKIPNVQAGVCKGAKMAIGFVSSFL